MKNTISISIALCGLLITINATAMKTENSQQNKPTESFKIDNELPQKKYQITDIKALNPNSDYIPLFIPINFNDLTPESIAALNNHLKNANTSAEGITVFEVEKK